MVNIFQTALSAGEIAPELYAREDIQKFGSAAKRIRNFIVDFRGGAFNRPGFEYIKNGKDEANKIRLIEMEFSTVQNYVLEFGHHYMRVFKDGGIVLEPPAQTTAAITAATQSLPVTVTAAGHGFGHGDRVTIDGVAGMAGLNSRSFTLINPTGTTFQLAGEDGGEHGVFHTGFAAASPGSATVTGASTGNPVEITTAAGHGFIHGDLVYLSGIEGMTQLNGRLFSISFVDATHFELNGEDGTNHDLYSSGGTAGKASVIEDASQGSDVEITAPGHSFGLGESVYLNGIAGMTELNDRTFTVANPNTDTFDLSGEDGTSHSPYAVGGQASVATSIGSASNADPVALTVPSHGFSDGDEVYLSGLGGMTALNGRFFTVTNVSPDSFDLVGEDGTGLGQFSSGTAAPAAHISGATQANPVVITAVGHGFANGETIHLTDIGGMTELNGRSFTIDVVDADSFSLTGEDGTAHGPYSGGTVAPAVAIGDAAASNPVLVTANGHGFVTGDTVRINGVSGMEELNRHNFAVGVVTTDSFELAGIDGTIFGTYVGGGAASPAIPIAEVAASNPVKITAPGHGLSDGAFIRLDDVGGIPELNRRVFKLANADTDTFELNGENGLEHGPYLGGGSLTPVAIVTGATQADPVEIAAASHGFVDGNTVIVENFRGMSELNNRVFAVLGASPDTFLLDGEDGTGHAAFIGGIAHKPTGAAAQITGATQTDPVLIAATGHGFANGETVYVTGVGGMTELNGRVFTIGDVTNDTFSLSGEDGTNYGAHQRAIASRVFEMATPYAADDLERLKFTQSADVMFLTHQRHRPAELTRTDHHVWMLSGINFEPSIKPPSGVTVSPATAGSEEYRYRVTAVKEESLEESLSGSGDSFVISAASQTNPVVIEATGHTLNEGDEVEIAGVVGMTELNGRRFRAADVQPGTTFQLEGEDGTGHGAYTSGGAALRTYAVTTSAATLSETNAIDITWVAPPGERVERYNVYREDNGIFGFIGATEDTIFVDDNILPEVGDTPPKARNPFLLENNFPSTVGFHEQRSVWGATFDDPQKTWMSQTADFKNLSVSNPTKDDDAVTYTIAARKVNEIRHFVSLSDLIVLTRGAVWRANAGDGPAITPTSIDVKPQSEDGASHVPPIVVGNAVLFVEDGGDVVRDLGFSLQADSYTGEDLTQLAPHIFKSASIIDWAYAKKPHRVIWVALDDGSLATLTFVKSQNIFAWSTHETAGQVESIATIREGREDVLYAVIRRTVGGIDRRFIERLRERRLPSIKDAFFVDSGLSYDAPMAIATISATNPVIVTTAEAHGLSNGRTIDIDGVSSNSPALGETSMAEAFNGERFVAQNITPTTFELTDFGDGSDIDGARLSGYRAGGICRVPIEVVGGLGHLEGEQVAILADGDVMPLQTVDDGNVAVGQAASRIHVGLPYLAEIETLPPPIPEVWGRKKSISKVVVVLAAARGLFIGRAGADLVPVERRSTEDWDDPIGLHSGVEEIAIHSGWNASEGILIRQEDPVPASVLGIIADVDIGG